MSQVITEVFIWVRNSKTRQLYKLHNLDYNITILCLCM